MISAYRGLAHTVAVLVALQAAFIVFAVSGLYVWVDDGNTLQASDLGEDGGLEFTGVIGFMLHGMVGMMLIPLVALVLLIVAFFAKVPGGIVWAAAIFGLVVLQVALGLFGYSTPYAGLLHGLNAMVLFTVALQAGLRVTRAQHPAEAASVSA